MVELVVTELPIETGNKIGGLRTNNAVSELQTLLSVSDLDNTVIEIPTEDDPKFPSVVKDTELKNFLAEYSGKTIRVLSQSHAKPKLLTF